MLTRFVHAYFLSIRWIDKNIKKKKFPPKFTNDCLSKTIFKYLVWLFSISVCLLGTWRNFSHIRYNGYNKQGWTDWKVNHCFITGIYQFCWLKHFLLLIWYILVGRRTFSRFIYIILLAFLQHQSLVHLYLCCYKRNKKFLVELGWLKESVVQIGITKVHTSVMFGNHTLSVSINCLAFVTYLC